MKTINVDSHNVPATARSRNYQTALATTAASGGGATMPSVVTPTGGAADTAKVAQNLAEDSTDWAKILRKDIDERTENSLSIGKNLTVDGQAILNDVVANTGTFGGLLKAAAATITGALLASTVSATTMNANTFIGELQGNAATATKLKTARTIWGQSFDGSGNVDGTLYTTNGLIIGEQTYSLDGIPVHGVIMGHTLYNSWNFGEYGGQYNFYLSNSPTDNASLIARIDTNNNYLSGSLGIGTTSPAYKLDVNGNMRVTSDLYADATVGTRNFASHTTGWRADSNGNADFRNIYADELRVQAFTADISQALAGSDYLTKSVSKLSANFVVPSVNSTVRIIVDDIEGMPATQCFSNNDYIRFRAFNRTSGLTIANVWGTVVLDATYGTNGFSNGTQAYTFTCTQTSGEGLTVFKGSEVLDYGTSGSGLIARTTLDAMGSPYEQIATWVNDPSNGNNYTVHARLGNLNGIANCNGYGIYTDNGFFTGKIVIGDLTNTANYLSFDTVNGLKIKLGGTSVATTTDVTTSVNNIQIGGRNLVVGTSTPKTITASHSDYYDFYYSFFHLEANKDYVFSCEVDCPTWGSGYSSDNSKDTVDAYVMKDGEYSYYIHINLSTSTLLSTGLYYNTSVFQVKQSGNYKIRLDVNYAGATHTFSKVMVAEGNKATTWSPAPEDVDANIATAQSTAISTAASNAAALYVSQSAYSSQVTILQNSINSKVSQTDFNALGTRVGTAESTITQHSTDIASKVAQTDYTGNTIASLINQTATTVAIQASKINLVGAVTIGAIDKSSVTPAALGAATPTDVSTAVNGIQVGGRNIARNSKGDFTYNMTDMLNYGSIMCIAYWVGNKNTNIVISGDVEYSNVVLTGTGSADFRVHGNQDIDGWGANIWISLIDKIHSGNGSFHFSFALTIPSIVNNNYWNCCFRSDYITGTVTFRNLKVEYGTKETSWTPAPEDVSQDAQNKVDELSRAHGGLTYLDAHSIYTGTLTANQVNAVGIDAGSITVGTLNSDRIGANAITADKIAANTITSDQINAVSVSTAIATVISLDAGRITTGKLSADRIDAVSVVAKGLVAQTIDAQSATISNLNVVNATVNGYFHAEYSGGAFVRIGMPASPKMLAIRADGLTGIDIGVYGDNSTGLSITANGASNGALDIQGSSYLITRQSSSSEGTWINGLSLCRVTITSGGDLGSGSLGWYQNGGYYMPNFIVSKASSTIQVNIPSDMPDGAVLIFRNAGDGNIKVSSKNFADKFQWGSQWNDSTKPYAPVVPGALNILVYDKSSHTWYSHGIS